jgi:RNA polymerase sigma-70 factor, ECF subfamily
MLMQFQEFDSSYLERLRSGDFSTQQHFVAYFSELIRLKVGKRLRSPGAIEDVRQETFTRVLGLLAEQRIHQPECIGSFVNSVCNNVLRERYRSECREIAPADGFVDAIPDRAISASDRLVTRQMQREVRQILNELSEKDRRLMKALFLEERDKDEVCREFGVNREYLRVLIHRAKHSFKSHYLRATQNAPARIYSVWIASFRSRRRTHRNEAFLVLRAPTQ